MSKRTGWIFSLLLAAAFLLANRDAYRGYFQDDEINSMAWTRWKPAMVYFEGALNPVHKDNFRPLGFAFFHIAEHYFGLDFPKYVAVLQGVHLLNVWLLWLLVRRLGSPPLAACVAVAFFGLHAAFFDTVWKPMYVFDLLCGTFCLASLVLWTRGRFIASFAAFWLAYQCKELAVMLPFVLLCYEWWFGQRRWLLVAPFVAASLTFAGLIFFVTPPAPGAYSYHFTLRALARTSRFYAGRAFLLPYLGFLLPVGAFLAHSRRSWFGLAILGLYLMPLLFLPGRIFSAYCYLPFTGLAVALAGMLEKAKPAAIAVGVLLFLPPEIYSLRRQTQDTLAMDRDIRIWMTSVGDYLRAPPGDPAFVYQGLPAGFYPFGAQATLRYYLHQFEVPMTAVLSPEAEGLRRSGQTALLRWNQADHRLEIEKW